MSQQSYNNHARMHPLFHYVATPLVIAGLIGSIVNLINGRPESHYDAALIVVLFLSLLFIGSMVRTYSLKVQDRAIRAEESLRHFVLTGKLLDSRLRISQIIALRFASDTEFPALAKKAAEENLSGKQIKQAILEWRADFYRV
jgi:hypothetical protein